MRVARRELPAMGAGYCDSAMTTPFAWGSGRATLEFLERLQLLLGLQQVQRDLGV